jgi:hypothetical protein
VTRAGPRYNRVFMPRAAIKATGALALVLIAGCGGSGSGADLFTLSATQTCLEKAGYHTAVVKNTTLPSSGGNLRVQIGKTGSELLDPGQRKGGIPPDTYVFLIFAKDPAAALATERRAVRISVQALKTRGLTVTPAAIRNDVGVANNVFFYSTTGGVTKRDRSKFTPCLQ